MVWFFGFFSGTVCSVFGAVSLRFSALVSSVFVSVFVSIFSPDSRPRPRPLEDSIFVHMDRLYLR